MKFGQTSRKIQKMGGLFLALAMFCTITETALACSSGDNFRWSIKTGTDPAAPDVDIANIPGAYVPVGIGFINSVNDMNYSFPPPPADLNTDTPRIDPEEMFSHTVQGYLVWYKHMYDGDYHLIITDPSLQYCAEDATPTGTSFITESTDPKCINGVSAWGDQIAATRKVIKTQFPKNIYMGAPIIVPVTVAGVLYYDQDTGQMGRSVYTIELHPLMDITFGNIQPVIENPGFEEGATGWSGNIAGLNDIVNASIANVPAHSGGWLAWMYGGAGNQLQYLDQNLSVPSTDLTNTTDPNAAITNATLNFWLHVTTQDTSTAADTSLIVQIKDPSTGKVLKKLGVFSNLNANSVYVHESFNISSFIGEVIRLYLKVPESSAPVTSFYLDDFYISGY